MDTRTGRCLCGSVSFTATDIVHHHHACHCDMCRRWTGGPAFAAAVGGVDWQGDEHIRRYLRRVLARTGGQVYGDDGAAAILGMKPTTLQSRLKRMGIDRERYA